MIENNIFACFISYPSLTADASDDKKEEAEKRGDIFRSYIWGDDGIDSLIKQISYYDYGRDIRRILIQFYVMPCDYERMNIKEVESYRKKEKSIAVSIIIEEYFFNTVKDRKDIISSSIISSIEKLENIIRKRNLDTNIKQLVSDLRNILYEYVQHS